MIETWRRERARIEQLARDKDRPLSPNEVERLLKLQSAPIEAALDRGHGACVMRDHRVADQITSALRHFDGQRYRLHAWCVMPNHVHVVVQPLPGHALDSILQSWKSFTAHHVNQLLGRSGTLWQAESYDHLIRNESDYAHAIEYLVRNPERAGLGAWRWVGQALGGMGVPPMGSVERSMGVPPMIADSSRAERPCHPNPQTMGGTPMPLQGTPTLFHGRDAHATQNYGPATFQTTEVGDYRAAVAGGLAAIAEGAVNKIVLARALDMRAQGPLHPLHLLNGLREKFPDCYSFSVANGRGHSFIGASPERLVRVSKGVLETEALAGSTRRGQSASEDAALGAALLASEKDRREHQHVLDSIRRRLEPLGLVLNFPATPVLRKFANVQHLQTPVSATLPSGVGLLAALAPLHPTPAVGGTPREAAVALIGELEGFPRGLYAGAIGWVNARGGGEFLVGIRSALIEGDTARVYAGAGIVAGSDVQREYAETELKFRAMREALIG